MGTKNFFMAASLMLALVATPGLVFGAGYTNSDWLLETDQLAKLINDTGVRIVDVRPGEAYRKGHSPNAGNLGFNGIGDPESRIQAHLLPAERLG